MNPTPQNPLVAIIAAVRPQPVWTWNGRCFGYRRRNSLFTYDGFEVGRFVGSEVYGPDGYYLGELRGTEDLDGLRSAGDSLRLITSSYKKARMVEEFKPTRQPGKSREPNRMPAPVYCGYEDFPSPEVLRRVVITIAAEAGRPGLVVGPRFDTKPA